MLALCFSLIVDSPYFLEAMFRYGGEAATFLGMNMETLLRKRLENPDKIWTIPGDRCKLLISEFLMPDNRGSSLCPVRPPYSSHQPRAQEREACSRKRWLKSWRREN